VRLDMDKIARGLRAERRGKVAASGGTFGALQLLADIEARFRCSAAVVSSGRAANGGRGATKEGRRLQPRSRLQRYRGSKPLALKTDCAVGEVKKPIRAFDASTCLLFAIIPAEYSVKF
jgi:hypothetical protein